MHASDEDERPTPQASERPIESMSDMTLGIAEALKRAGVTARVAFDGVQSGTFVISDVPRGRRPTIERVMATFSHRWRYGLVRR